ncbi:hypothetical protein R6Q59_027495 [Mikania micrantha]
MLVASKVKSCWGRVGSSGHVRSGLVGASRVVGLQNGRVTGRCLEEMQKVGSVVLVYEGVGQGYYLASRCLICLVITSSCWRWLCRFNEHLILQIYTESFINCFDFGFLFLLDWF